MVKMRDGVDAVEEVAVVVVVVVAAMDLDGGNDDEGRDRSWVLRAGLDNTWTRLFHSSHTTK